MMSDSKPTRIFFNQTYKLTIPKEFIEKLGWTTEPYVMITIQDQSLVIKPILD